MVVHSSAATLPSVFFFFTNTSVFFLVKNMVELTQLRQWQLLWKEKEKGRGRVWGEGRDHLSSCCEFRVYK